MGTPETGEAHVGYTDETVGDQKRGRGWVPSHWQQRAHGWRAEVRARPRVHRIYKTVIGVVGATIALAGLLMVPLPGPGWLVVFIGVAVLASEFTWARRLERFGLDKLQGWTRWLGRQRWPVRAMVIAATCAFVIGVVCAVGVLTGSADWFLEQLKILSH